MNTEFGYFTDRTGNVHLNFINGEKQILDKKQSEEFLEEISRIEETEETENNKKTYDMILEDLFEKYKS